MYFNRKNSQQKNWRMIKKGKHFLFGCALVFTLGATANVAGAETISTEATTVDQAQDSTAASEDADSEAAASTTAVSEVASSTTTTSEAASETVSTSTVASSEASETTSTASEVAVSESSEASTVASSEAASSETASSTTVEAASEVSATVSASETAVANRTAYIGYEVQYTTSTGEVVGKTANIVATDTTDAVATSTLTVAATDVPAGYELAAEQAYSLTQQISENQINILSFAVVKKSEEEEIAESQLANKTVLEQVISEAIVLSDEALRQVATTQAGNTELEAAATSTQETVDNAIIVLEDASATQEQVDSQVETVKASTLALADEMLKVDEDGNLTVALNTTGTSISSTRGYGTTDNVISNYEVRDGYVYWTHQFNNGYANTNYYNYFFTIPKSVGAMEDLVVTQYNQDGTVRSTSNSWPDGEGSEGGIAPNIGPIGNGYFDKKGLNEGRVNAPLYNNNNHISSAIERTGFSGSDAILNNSQSEYYVLNSNRRTNRLTRWVVTYRTPIVDENGSLDYIAGGSSNIKADNNDVVVGTYGALFKEVPEFYNQQKVDKGQNQNQLNDMLVWRNTEMTTPYQLPIKDNGVAIDEIYYVLADTAATEKITVDNLTISNTGVVTGSASFTGEPKTIEAVIKSGDTLVQSEQAWIVVMDAQGSTINKNEGETVTNQEILDAVTVDWGGYDKTWEYGEAGLTKEVITPTLPTSGQNNVVQVKLTNAQGQEKIVDVIVNWPVTIQAIDQYNITWDNQSVSGRTDEGFELVQDEKGNKVLIYKYDLDNHTAFSMDDVLKQLNATPKDSSSGLRTLDGIEKSKIENNQEGYTTDWNTAKLNGQTIDFLDVVNPDPLWGGRKVVDSTTDSNTKHSTFYIPGTTDIGTASNSVTVGGTNGVDTITVTDNNRNLYSNQVDRQKLYIRSTPASTEDGTNSAVDNDTDTDTIPVYMVGYKNNTPTTGTNKKPLYVFNNTPIATVGAGTDVADNVNKVNVVTLEDPQGINSVEVTRETDVNTTVFNPSSIGITIDTDGNASGTPSVGPIGAYSRGLTVTDGTGAKTNLFPRNNEMETYVLDATAGATITKAVGESVTEAEILDNVTVATGNSNTMDAAIDSRYRKVLAPDQKVPTTEGTHTVIVRVITESNVYKDVPVTVIIPDSTAPEAPVVTANPDGTVTVTPSQTAGDDTKTTDITYTDENGTPQTVTVTKGEDGNWSIPADSGVTVDPSTGAVTIPADKVQDGSTVSAVSKDEAGNTSNPATDIAKDNPDTTAPAAPAIETDLTGKAGTTDPIKVTGAEPGSTVTLKDPAGNVIGTGTANDNGEVEITPTTPLPEGSITATSTDKAGNESDPSAPKEATPADKTAPAAPAIETDLTGKAGTTDPIKVTGAEPGSTVTLKDPAGNVIGTGTANDNGEVEITPTTPLPEGSITATSTDKAGNESDPSAPKEATPADKTAPAAPAIETDLTGKAGTTDPIKVTGAEPGSTVTLKDPAGNVIGTGTANDNGEVEITPTTPLPEGSITATSTDKAGNESDPSAPKESTPADKTAPAAPAIETDLTGKAGTTDPIKVTGAEPGSTVTLKDPAGNVIGTGTANDNGEVEITPTTPLPEGSITATSTDKAGNESDPSAPKEATPADKTAPAAPAIETDLTGKAGTTDPIKVTGAEPGSTVTLKDPAGNVIGTGTANDNGEVEITPTTPLPEGSITATSTDKAGNESDPSAPKESTPADKTAPAAPAIETDLTGKAGTTDPIKVTGAEPGSTVTLKDPAGNVIGTGTANDNGEVEITPTTPLPEGSITATSTDKAGNESDPSAPKESTPADKTAPAAPAIETDLTGKAGTTDPIKVTGAEPGSTVTLKDPAGNVIGTGTANDNGEVEITPTTPLPEGSITATSTDKAGNESDPSAPKEATPADKTAPAAPAIETDLTGKAGTTDPIKVTGAEPGSTVTLKDPAGNVIGTGTANDNGEVEITPTTPLPEGSITATSTDKAGNESDPSAPKEATPADKTAPAAPAIETDLTGKAGTTDPIKVTGAEPGSTVTLKDPAGNVIGTGTANDNGEVEITPTTPLPEGSITATSTDKAGNESDPSAPKEATPADKTAPAAPVVNAPKEGDTTVTGTAEPGSTVTVNFPDGSTATTTADENGNYTVDVPAGVELKEGDKVTATATDEAGNTSDSTEKTVTANPSDADENTPNTPAVTPVADTNNLTDDEKAKVKEEVEKSNPNLPTGTTVEVGNDGTVTITYPDGSVDTIPGTDTVTPKTDTTAPEAPAVNAPKAGDTTVTGTTEPGATVTVTFPDGTEVTTTADENGNYTVDVPAGVELKEGDKVSAKATDEAGNTSDSTEKTVTANPSDADENTPNTPAVTPVADTNNLTDDEKAKVKEEVEKSNPNLPTGTTVEVGNDGTVTITYPDGSVDTIPGTDTVTPNTDTTAPEAPVVNAPKAGDTTVTGTAEPGATVTVTFPDGSTATTTADENGNYTVDVPAGVELKEGDKVTATATDEAGNTSDSTEKTVTANPSDADENTPNTPAVTPVADTNNLTDDEKAKVKEEVEKSNPNLPTGTTVEVGNDGTVTITYPDGSVDTIPGTDTVTPKTDTTAPEAPAVNAPKAGDTTVTGTAEPGSTVTVNFPDGSTATTTADENGNYTVDVPAGVELKEGDKVTATATDKAGNESPAGEGTTVATPDTTAPEAPVVNAPKAGDTTVTGTAEPGSTVTVTFPDGSTATTTADENGNYTVDVPAGVELKEGDKVSAKATDEAGNTSTPTEATTTANPSDADENTPNTPAVTPVADTNNLTDDEKAKVKDEVEKANPDLPTGTTVEVGNDGTVTITYPDGSVDTIPGTDTVVSTTPTPQTDAEKNDLTNPTKTPVADTNNLTEDEKAKVKEEVEKSNPNLPTGTTVEVGNDGTVTITYPDGSVDTIPGTDTVVTTTPTLQTDAEKNDLTNPTKTPVADVNNLTDDEKAKVKDEVEKSNPDLPSGTTITVGNDGTATITYPDGSTDTLTGTVTVIGTTPTPQTDAEKNDVTNPTKTPVADTNNLTEDEKAKVKDEVEKSNPDLPSGTTITVGNDGTATITYPDGSTDTLTGTVTVIGTTPTPQTDAEKNDLTNPTKTPVADTNNLTEDEKAKVKEEVEKSNPNLPTGTTVEVGNDGTVTVTYPDGSVDTIPGTDTVATEPPYEPVPQTDAEKNGITNPTKTPVADTNNLTEDEKAKVKEEVEKSNPGLPSGTTIEVGNDGSVAITYPDGSIDIIPGADTVVPTTPVPQTDAEKNDVTNPAKTPVADTNNLTEEEKAKVKEEVEKSNPGLPSGTTIEVSNGGSVTITYPDGSIDIIPATDAVVPTTPTPQTDAEKNGISNPTKTPVADTNNLTEDEKAKVKEEVEKSNPGLPTGTTIEVSNGGSVTITYPDGSIDIIPGADTVVPTTPTPQTDAEKNGITNPTKTPVADTNNLTEEEKAKVKEEVEKSNPGLPTGTTIEVSNGGSVTITYPDGSIDIIPATDAVVPTTPTPQTDAEKNGITNPTKTPVADTNNLTEEEKAKVKEEVEKSNPGLPSGTTIVVGNDGSVTITYPDGSIDIIPATDAVVPTTPTPQTDAEKNDVTNPAKTPVADTNNLTEDEKAKVKEEVEKSNPGLPTGTTIVVGNDGSVTITYPDGSVDTISGTDTVNPNTDTTAPEAPIVNTPKAGDKTVTGTAEPGSTITVTFPDGSTVTTTADENGNFTVDVPAGVELKEGDKVTATATDGAGNTSTSAIVTVVSKGSSTGTTETGTENGNSANRGTEEVISKSTSETASQGNTVNNVSGAVKEATEDNKQAVLPKTGEESGAMSLIGLVALSGLGLLAFKRRRKEEE